MESVNSSVTAENLAEPVQRLIRSLPQTLSQEELNLLSFISVKDVNVVYAELAGDNDAETVWHQLRTALQAQQRRSLHRDQQVNALSSLPRAASENSNKTNNNDAVTNTIVQPVHESSKNDTTHQLNTGSAAFTEKVQISDSSNDVMPGKSADVYTANIPKKGTCDHSSAEPVCKEEEEEEEYTEPETRKENSILDVLIKSKAEKANAELSKCSNELKNEHTSQLQEQLETPEQTNGEYFNTNRVKQVESNQTHEQLQPFHKSESHDQQINSVMDSLTTSTSESNSHFASMSEISEKDHVVDHHNSATESHSNYVTPHKTYASYLASEDSSDGNDDDGVVVDDLYDNNYDNNTNVFSHPLAINTDDDANVNAKRADKGNNHNNFTHATISLPNCNNPDSNQSNTNNKNYSIACDANNTHMDGASNHKTNNNSNGNSVNSNSEITQKKLYHILNTPPKQTTDLLRRVYGAKCPMCGTRFAHPPLEWDCPLCLRKLGDRVKVWQPDESSEVCMLCHRGIARFSRHHCRSCGRLTCSRCCTAKAIIHGLGFDGPVKVCDDCAKLGKE